MQPFPPSEDLAFFVGLEVAQICLDPWSTQLKFEDGGQITIEGPFEHTDTGQVTHSHQVGDDQDRGPVYLRDLIQRRIIAVSREERALTLEFDNGAKVKMVSEKGRFESGQIHTPGREGRRIVF